MVNEQLNQNHLNYYELPEGRSMAMRHVEVDGVVGNWVETTESYLDLVVSGHQINYASVQDQMLTDPYRFRKYVSVRTEDNRS